MLLDDNWQEVVEQALGPVIERTTENRDLIAEQPCRIDQASEEMYYLLEQEPQPWIGIVELHKAGIGIFVSRASKPFAFLIPYWRFNLSKGEQNVALFNGEHFLRIFPQNEDLGTFTRNLVSAKIQADQQKGSPTW